MSKITTPLASPDRPVTAPDAKASEAVRSGEQAQTEGRELTETEKVAIEENKLASGGVAPEYKDAEAEGGAGTSATWAGS
ncbi:hypothetical protein [Aureimonas sp. AU40]|uniref:hypothetical protein n=1 Tax=Aureimonas sp. AU40 TaxID=1637747 RepID=UPI000781E768|nr:hypothetical protein [Aureimonas sp. AU40]